MKTNLLYLTGVAMLFLTGMWQSASAQSCSNPVSLVSWDITTCQAGTDYSEFTPTAISTAACPSMTASGLYRNSGHHSCNPGPANGDGFAFCMPNFDGASWQDNAPYAIRFSVSFGANEQGALTELSFWQNGSDPTLFMGGGSTNNDYPTLYGMRVVKNGVEIFESIDLGIDTVWTHEQIDFSSDPDFAYSGVTTFEFELLAYAPIGNGYAMSIWDVDMFELFGCCVGCNSFNYTPTIADVSCNGANDGSVMLGVSGGTFPYTYQWSTGDSTAGVFNVSPGFYTVNVLDANGCSGTASYYVDEPSPLQVSATSIDPLCAGDGGSADAIATGGTPAYTYVWSDGQSGSSATNLAAGSFGVTVTDANGCSDTASVSITEPTPLQMSFTVTNSTCGQNNGGANVSVSGGTAPYNYLWSDGSTTSVIVNQVGGGSAVYVTITDANGCTLTDSVSIGDDAPQINCIITPGAFRTQTQGGWGAPPNGNNPGVYLHANFTSAFPGGLVIGCNETLTLTSANAVTAYLPCGGPSSALSQSYTDPSCLSSTVISQLIAATISVTFDQYDANFGSSSTNLSDLIVVSGPMSGLSVEQVLIEANNAIGGCGSNYSLNQINSTLSNINQNFVDGTIALGYLACPMACPGSSLPVAPTGSMDNNTAMTVWPNPSMQESINVMVEVSNAGQAQLRILDLDGRAQIRNENLGELEAGTFIYTWDGCRARGDFVQPGFYLIEVVVGDDVYRTRVLRL